MIQEGTHKLIVRSSKVPYLFPVQVTHIGGGKGLKLKFSYNPYILNEVKSMEGRRWVPEEKAWTIANSPRNEFAFNYLKGINVYKHWDQPAVQLPTRFPLMEHQKVMFNDGATYLHDVWAAEMGTGKTLACFALLEYLVLEKKWTGEKWYVGTRSSIRAVNLEKIKWKPKVWFDLVVTYDSLKKIIQSWPAGKPAPRIIFCDESSRIKNPTTQRSQMAKHIVDSMHREYALNSCIIEMSGTPAPKEPTDWWHQCEIVCPGYLKEGSIIELRKRLALVIQKENIITGAAYPHLVTWWDDEKKCKHCGSYIDFEKYGPEKVDTTREKIGKAEQHDKELAAMTGKEYHAFEPSVNEVLKLHQRMKGLVRVIFKKDCMNLPEKVFKEIELTPSKEVLRAAKLITKVSRTTMDMMVRLRELSDGFQYKEQETGQMVDCFVCGGTGKTKEGKNVLGEVYDPQRASMEREEIIAKWRTENGVAEDYYIEPEEIGTLKARLDNQTERCFAYVDCPCSQCDSTGKVPEVQRVAVQVPTPKEQALLDILEDHEDVGRCVAYAGFAGSIDRICEIVKRNGWDYLRFDGRGVVTSWELPRGYDPISQAPWDCLAVFQKLQDGPEKIVFVGHPMAAGMGLTLTASPSIVYWSNDYNAESKIQSMDRIHRPGMDLNRGATIYELLHLPSDRMVLENLRKKQDLQALTLGVVKRRMDEVLEVEERR